MAVDTLFNDVRVLIQGGGTNNLATNQPWHIDATDCTAWSDYLMPNPPLGVIAGYDTNYAQLDVRTADIVFRATVNEGFASLLNNGPFYLVVTEPGIVGVFARITAFGELGQIWEFPIPQTGDVAVAVTTTKTTTTLSVVARVAQPSGFVSTHTSPTIDTPFSIGEEAQFSVADEILVAPPDVTITKTVTQVGYRAGYPKKQKVIFSTGVTGTFTPAGPMVVTATNRTVVRTYEITSLAPADSYSTAAALGAGIAALVGATAEAVTSGQGMGYLPILSYAPTEVGDVGWTYTFNANCPQMFASQLVSPEFMTPTGRDQITRFVITTQNGSASRIGLGGGYADGLAFTVDAAGMAQMVAHINDEPMFGWEAALSQPFPNQFILIATTQAANWSPFVYAITGGSGYAFDRLYALRITVGDRYATQTFGWPGYAFPVTSIPGGGGGSSDTNTLLLMHFDESSGTTLKDETGRTFTTTDIATHTTASGKFSRGVFPASNTWDGAVGSSPVNISGGVFTIEFFVARRGSGATTTYETVFAQTTNSGTWTDGLVVFVSGDNNLVQAYLDGIPTNGAIIGNTPGVWQHIALVRSGNGGTDTKWYVNGVGESGFATGYATHANVNPTIGNAAPSAGYRLNSVGIDELRISNVARYTADFTPPTAPFEIGGGTGWGTLPADVIFAVPAESNGNDVAQFGLSASVSGTATIQASGSRTGDGYLRNTDSAQGADACFGYTPSAGFQAAWAAAQSMTLEFDIRYDTGGYLGGQILGIGSGYSSLSDNGPSGIAITGSPFAVAAGSATLTPGAWHHIAFVADYNAGDRLIRTYRDGVQQDTPQSVLAFWFNDYPTPTTIGLLQFQAGFIGNGALKGGLDNIILTTRAKYNANFTPGVSFPEIVGYTPPPSNVDVTAAGYNDLDDITGSGTFNTQLTVSDAYFFSTVTLGDTSGNGDAYTLDGNSINFTGSRTLGATTCTGTFVRGTPQNFDSDVTLDDATAESTFFADTPKEWSGDSALDDATQFGLMMFLAPASFSGDATAEDTYSDGVADVITPPTMRVSTTLPALRLTASGAPRAFSGVVTTLPELAATARGGHYATFTLPTITATATGTTIAMARAIMTIPMVEVEATGRVAGQSSVQTRLPRIEVSSFGGHQAEVTLPAITASATTTVGGAAQAELSLPRITAAAHGYRDDTARVDITLPMLVMTPSAVVEITLPAFTVLAHGQPVLTDAYEAYVLNMNQPLDDNPRNNFEAKVEQVTRYTNWPFIQVVRLGDAYYGVAEDGLYELGGATDNGTEIDWDFETCKTDFDDPHKKAVASAYIGGQTGPDLTYTLRSGDDVDRMYEYVTTKVVQKRNHRQKFGLGRRVRYYSFGLAGRGEAAIDTLEFELLSTTRRI